MYTLLKYMIKCIKHGTIRIIYRITLDQYHPSGLKALWMILVSRDDTAYDTDFAMYYSLCSWPTSLRSWQYNAISSPDIKKKCLTDVIDNKYNIFYCEFRILKKNICYFYSNKVDLVPYVALTFHHITLYQLRNSHIFTRY